MGLVHTTESYEEFPNSTYLNTVDLWVPTPVRKDGIWVIYIHGGAWRDPEIGSGTFLPALSILDASPSNIAGYASINYRLSPYLSHPRKPSSPHDPARNIKNPKHVEDVAKALCWLQRNYEIHQRYLLVGHSCGAFMAFQVGSQHHSSPLKIPVPIGVVGSEGIYHIPAMLESHADISVYRDFIEGAFGKDEKTWDTVSPAVAPPGLWGDAKVLVISHSENDGLLEMNQANLMQEHLKMSAGKAAIKFIPVKGSHDEIWKEGKELARIILETLSML